MTEALAPTHAHAYLEYCHADDEAGRPGILVPRLPRISRARAHPLGLFLSLCPFLRCLHVLRRRGLRRFCSSDLASGARRLPQGQEAAMC